MNEFEIIEHHFRRHAIARDDVVLGIGDDAALLRVPAGSRPWGVQVTRAAVSGETPEAFAAALVDRAIARLSCRGMAPRWATLALTLPREDAGWLSAFATTLATRLAGAGVALVGGDTTRGPTTATLAVHGCTDAVPAPAPVAAGHRVMLADAGDAEAAAALRRLAARVVVVSCDGDLDGAARTLVGERALRVVWAPARPAEVAAGAVLFGLPDGGTTDVPGAFPVGALQVLADA